MKSTFRFASVFISLLVATPFTVSAQAQSLTNNERQYLEFVRDADFTKANFYISQGLVNPLDLSTGKPLQYYFYGPGTFTYSRCRAPAYEQKSMGDCTPGLDVLNYLRAGKIDLNKPINGKARPLTYVCWGSSIGVNNTRILVEKEGVETNFRDDSGFTPLDYCAWRGIGTKQENIDDMLRIVSTLIDNGADVNGRLTLEAPIGAYKDVPINPGATPLMLSVWNWWGEYPRTDLIQYLIQRGADPAATDDAGATVINYLSYPSRDRYIDETIELLKVLHANGVDIMHKRPKDGKSLFDQAMENGHVDFAMEIMAIAGS
jgi:ankyrin repeat protein